MLMAGAGVARKPLIRKTRQIRRQHRSLPEKSMALLFFRASFIYGIFCHVLF
jgi:hypothetical protein